MHDLRFEMFNIPTTTKNNFSGKLVVKVKSTLKEVDIAPDKTCSFMIDDFFHPKSTFMDNSDGTLTFNIKVSSWIF